MMFLVVVTAILASAWAQSDPPPHCCGVEEFESHVRILTVSFNRTSGQALRELGMANLTYDRPNMRSLFSYQGRDDSGVIKQFQVLNLFNQNLRYMISASGCTSGESVREMRSNCVPATAQAQPPTYVGQFGDHLSARAYLVEDEGDGTRVVTLTNQDCFPLVIRQSGLANNVAYMREFDYIGATAGIRDPGVFAPPANCGAN